MKEVTEFSKLPINKIEDWEKQTNSAIFFDDEKGIAFQKATDEEGNPAIIVMFGNDAKENSIILIDGQFSELKKFLARQ